MANEAVLKYLRATNRPYSTNDIVLNLHKEFGKTAVQRALDTLSLQPGGPVMEKVYGKQKIYVIRQDDGGVAKDEDIKEMDEKIATLSAELKTVDDALKATEGQLKELQSSLTTEQARKEADVLQKEVTEMEIRLEDLKKNATPVSPGKMERAQKEKDKYVKEYRFRKRLCMDIMDAVLEGYPKSKKAFMEDIGLETDEDAEYKPLPV